MKKRKMNEAVVASKSFATAFNAFENAATGTRTVRPSALTLLLPCATPT